MIELRELRKENDLSLRDAEDLTGISRGDLSRWENSKEYIHEAAAIELANLFEVSHEFLRNLQILRSALFSYMKLSDNLKNIDPAEGIEILWKAERRLNKIAPQNSTITDPHPDLTQEIEYWRQKILWIVQDAKEAVRGGTWLMSISEPLLDTGFDLFDPLQQLEIDENQTDTYFYLDRAFTELIDHGADFRYVHRQRRPASERYSYGLSVVDEQHGIPEVMDLIQNHEWEELRQHDVIQKAHDHAREVAEFLKARSESSSESDDQATA